jgi:ABC-type uncharacterized transport system permease subunit
MLQLLKSSLEPMLECLLSNQAAFLFGILYQGGSEVTFDMPNITRYMFVAVQGVIILFSGALENLFRPQIESFFVNRINKEEMA